MATVHKPTGWNTWDFRGFNRFVYLDRGRVKVALLFAIWDDDVPAPAGGRKPGKLFDTFRWTDVTRLGPHAPLGLPAELEFKAGQTPYRVEARDYSGTLDLTVTPLVETRQRVVFVFVTPPDTPPTIKSPTRGLFAGCRVEFGGAAWPSDYFLNINEPFASGEPGQAATVRVVAAARAEASGSSAVATTPVDRKPEALVGDGTLADAPEAMMQAVAWNTLYDTHRRLVSSPVSRDWCYDWGGVAVFCWDTYLLGALVSYESPELARLNFEAVNAAIDELGFVPNYYVSHGAASLDRSMPPIGAYLIWKTQAPQPDRAWLTRVYRQLRRWHGFWMKNRDGNGKGLLQWGSNREPYYEYPQLCTDETNIRHSAQAAKWESGLDNSPMYDDVPFNEQTNTLELDDVGLSSYYALDCESLAAIAEYLGKHRDAARYREEYKAIRQRINDLLWDEQNSIYCNRHWDGRLSKRWSPTSFLPLIAGVVPHDRAERMIREHLLNENEFWGHYVIPSIARNDPAYPDNDYWRGRIWGPFNFLVAEGLRRYRFDDVASELAHKGLEMFMRNWREDGGVYENYNAETGAGGDVWNAARLYHWGGLLAFIAIQELIDLQPPATLRIGSLNFPNASIRNVRLGGAVYDVELDKGVQARRNGAPLVNCTTRAIVRIPLHAPPEQPIEISAAGSARLTLHSSDAPARPARVNAATLVSPSPDGSVVNYVW
ncbi:MAG TPA: trehalase family glycosidase [Phycisphaerae bacterium]|nr:trehalase family glycosidase [Phycisphaerae bacterium]